ncbi:MAG: AAA family ATPase [Candidatus Liptonbacteria bacterium]|nr:AAA family ATPase [Candidatus Liptonbacteria bacterium]
MARKYGNGDPHRNREALDATKVHPEAEKLRDFLEARLIGQPRIIKTIVEAYSFRLSGIQSNEEIDEPIVVVLELGPSGVGKTHVAELVAEFFNGSRKAMTKIKCANFQERHKIDQLLGAPAGYIGYANDTPLSRRMLEKYALQKRYDLIQKTDKRAAQLIEEMNKLQEQMDRIKDPRTKVVLEDQYDRKVDEFTAYVDRRVHEMPVHIVLLFDEIEKAHDTLFNFILEVADKGTTTLSSGEEVDLRWAFIFETSNEGAKDIADKVKNLRGLGFVDTARHEATSEDIYKISIRAAEKKWSPEYLARHEVVVFHPLSSENNKKIFQINLDECLAAIRKKGFLFELEMGDDVREFIWGESSDHPAQGSRILRKKIRKYITGPIANLIGSGQLTADDRVLFVELSAVEVEGPDRKDGKAGGKEKRKTLFFKG